MAKSESEDKKVKNFKWKRIGKCRQCGICCMIHKGARSVGKKEKNYIDFDEKCGLNKVHETKNRVYYAHISSCPNLYISKRGKFRCKIHKKGKPIICKEWPFSPEKEYYKILKKFCGYRFKKVKNR